MSEEFKKPSTEALAHRYADNKAPAKDQAERLELLRGVVEQTAKDIVELTPVSPEQTRALNALDEVWMLGKLAIIRNEKR